MRTLGSLFQLLLVSQWLFLGAIGFGSEKAFFDTPTLAQNVSHRQNVCDRYYAFKNGTVELKDSLDGLKLNVLAMVYDEGFFNYDEESGIDPDNPGLVAVLLDELARRGGFTWRDSFGISRGPTGDKTWTDLLLWGIDTYDINADWWAQNLDRLNSGAVFLEEWYDSSIILIKQEQPELISEKVAFWNFLRPYTLQVWLVALATILLSGLVYQFLEWLADTRRDRTLWVWFSENCYLSFINFTQAYEYRPKTAAQRVFGISMAIWALVMTATYTANLASLLVDRLPNQIEIYKIEGVQQRSSMYKICTWADTNSDIYIKKTYPGITRIPKRTLEEVYEGLRTDECQFAAETVASWLKYERDQTFNPTCDLSWVGGDRKVLDVAAGFAAKGDSGSQCTGLIRDVLNWHMADMKADGFLEDAWNREYDRTKTIDCDVYRPELAAAEAANQGVEDSASNPEDPAIRRLLRHKFNDYHPSRKLKAATKGASAGAAIGTGDGQDQLTLNQMIGTFVFHWGFLGISCFIGVIQFYWEQRNARLKESSEYGDSVESTSALTKDPSKPFEEGDQASSSHSREFREQRSGHLQVNDPYMVGKSEQAIPKQPRNADADVSISTQLAEMRELMEDFKSQMRNENRHLRLKIQNLTTMVAEKDKFN